MNFRRGRDVDSRSTKFASISNSVFVGSCPVGGDEKPVEEYEEEN